MKIWGPDLIVKCRFIPEKIIKQTIHQRRKLTPKITRSCRWLQNIIKKPRALAIIHCRINQEVLMASNMLLIVYTSCPCFVVLSSSSWLCSPCVPYIWQLIYVHIILMRNLKAEIDKTKTWSFSILVTSLFVILYAVCLSFSMITNIKMKISEILI